jgi:exopolysaccharide production protein ExoF
MSKRSFVATVSLFGLLGLSLLPVAAAAEPYHLGVADKVRVKAYEWQNTVGEVHEWAAVNGDFSVGPGGTLSMPLIGDIPAAGHTVEELSSLISDRLQATVKMDKGPTVSVEILEYRPFYIIGEVNKPGEYPYRPGMTVLQALSIAGGVYRLDDPAFRKAALTTQGDLRVLLIQYYTLLARRARIQAELNASDKIDFPAELFQRKGVAAIAQIISQEQTTFTARRGAFQSQSDALTRLKDLLNKEIVSLNGKIANGEQELTMLKGELDRMTSLVGRGLVVAPQEFAVRQNYMEMQGRRLDLDTAMLKAKEEIARTDQALIELSNQYHNELLIQLTAAESNLAEVSTRMEVAKAIVKQDALVDRALADAPSVGDEPMQYNVIDPLTYSLIRRGDDAELHEIDATETTTVEPGDTIRVRLNNGQPLSKMRASTE